MTEPRLRRRRTSYSPPTNTQRRHHHHHRTPTQTTPMAPKPASTAGKAPVASKAPASSAAKDKAGKATKTAKTTGGEEKKKTKRKKRTETYSSYIYKGSYAYTLLLASMLTSITQFSSRFTPIPVSPTRPWPSSTPSLTTSSSVSPLRRPVRYLSPLNCAFYADQFV